MLLNNMCEQYGLSLLNKVLRFVLRVLHERTEHGEPRMNTNEHE